MQVFVLLFNVGTDNEGLHTLQISGQNIVLMFEAEDDAMRYALLLEAQDFATPSVVEIAQKEIEEFCEASGYHAQFVPAGFVPQTEAERLLMVPPEQNLEKTDWELAAEETDAELDDALMAEADEAAPAIASDDLERIRRQLEGLL